MADSDDRLRYALAERDHERIFQQKVLPAMLPASEGVVNPTAIILGGQPGSGKTGLLNDATREMEARGPTVVINGDDMRAFHPEHSQMQRTDPLNAARYTDYDSGRWVEKLIAAAKKQQVNLVIESTMRRPEVFAKTASSLRDAGYRVEARALAVPERLSWQSVHQRFEAMLEKGDASRFTARDAHDAGATGMLETLRQLERENQADRVVVSTRAGEVLYDNRQKNGRWRDAPAAANVVLAERQRPLSPPELRKFGRDWSGVLDKMKQRQASPSELTRVTAQAEDDIRWYRAAANELPQHSGLIRRLASAGAATAAEAPAPTRVGFGRAMSAKRSASEAPAPAQRERETRPEAEPVEAPKPAPRRSGPDMS